MIKLHKLNGDEFILNSSHIEVIEAKPDTVITLTNDRKYLVKEGAEEIIELVKTYRKGFEHY
jgi:flagellar protein FlbD